LGLQSTLAGFVGKVPFLVPLSALVFALYDLAWTFELRRLNDGA
jgi:hypothetical protein